MWVVRVSLCSSARKGNHKISSGNEASSYLKPVLEEKKCNSCELLLLLRCLIFVRFIYRRIQCAPCLLHCWGGRCITLMRLLHVRIKSNPLNPGRGEGTHCFPAVPEQLSPLLIPLVCLPSWSSVCHFAAQGKLSYTTSPSCKIETRVRRRRRINAGLPNKKDWPTPQRRESSCVAGYFRDL